MVFFLTGLLVSESLGACQRFGNPFCLPGWLWCVNSLWVEELFWQRKAE